MTIIHAKNRHGNIYPYFICLGRNNKRTTCDMPHAPMDRVEKLVSDYYQRITLTPAMTDALRGMLMHAFDQLTAGTNHSVRNLTDRRKQILAEQDKLLEAHLADALSLEQLKKFQTRLRAKLDGIESQIAEHHHDYQGARTPHRRHRLHPSPQSSTRPRSGRPSPGRKHTHPQMRRAML